MIRLTALYHDDTREPVRVVVHGRSRKAFAFVASDGTVHYLGGEEGRPCAELLLRERRHWEESKCRR